jgi:hypothetical protein
VAQTVRKWGLIGPWSLDCSLKPDRNRGTVLAYEIAPGDRVVHRRNFGDTKDESEVVTADVSGDGMLNLRVFFPSLKQTRQYGLMKQPDGTIRAIARAETVVIKRGDHHHFGARAEFREHGDHGWREHRDHGWHEGWRHRHADRVAIVRHRRHDY